MHRFKWWKSIFFKMILVFLCMMSIVYILGAIIYNQGSLTLLSQLTDTNVSHLSYYVNSLENEIKRIKSLQYGFVHDDNLYKLSSISDYIDDVSLLEAEFRLYQRLVTIKESSIYINNVFVIIPSTDKLISTRGDKSLRMDKEIYESLKRVSLSSNASIVYYNNKMLLSAVYPLSNGYNEHYEPKYIVGVELLRSELQKSLDQFKQYSEGGGILVGHNIENSIGTEPVNRITENISDYIRQQPVNKSSGASTLTINGEPYFVFYVRSDYLGITLCKYELQSSVLKPLQQFKFQYVLFFISTFFIIVIYSIFTYKFIQQPLSKLIYSFKIMAKGQLNAAIEHKQDDEFSYLYNRFNDMLEKLNMSINQVYKQKILVQKSELKHLQSQINPHFLYNSFFILQSMIEGEEYDTAKDFTSQMGSYFRFITRSASNDVVLSEEVYHAKIYAVIMTRRFRNRVRLEFEELPEEYKSMMVPKLIVQPMLENAFEHGIVNKLDNGLVSVRFTHSPRGICICIEDNGSELKDEDLKNLNNKLDTDDGETTGIVNVHKRVRIKYGFDSGVRVCRGESGGLRVCINITLGEVNGNVQTVDC